MVQISQTVTEIYRSITYTLN